ncbi:MAG: hypothetical protein HZB31_05280 [Nitrospirae bacterium]|nr:hypothetical protein [Nitrospirota bacterium]
MEELKTYSSYAVFQELNRREFRKMLALFPDELRHYVIASAGIIGAENAKRVAETPEAVVKDGADFAAQMLAIVNPGQDEAFRRVLETYLVYTMKGELRYCCSNCSNFNICIDLANLALSVGHLFKKQSEGQDSDELKREIALQLDSAFQRTPYLETDKAQLLCKEFRHQYTASSIGDVFNRYADIAAELQHSFGLDYRKIQQEIIALNMEFYAKSEE